MSRFARRTLSVRLAIVSLCASVSATLSPGLSGAFAADVSAPTVPVLSGPAAVVLGTHAILGWTASDPAGIGSYDVRRRVAPSRGSLGSYTTLVRATRSRTRAVVATPGSTWCWSARARDAAGNTSAWSPDRCVTFALDDSALRPSGGFARVAGRSYFGGHALRASAKGARVLLATSSVRDLRLVATTCPTCGSVLVKIGRTTLATVSLRSARTVNRAVVTLLALVTPRVGAITVGVTSSGKPVVVDGLAVTPPAVSASTTLANGARYTRTRSVGLTTLVSGYRGSLRMRAANGTSVTGVALRAYSRSRTWTLPPGDGPKHVATQVQDAGGEQSAVVDALVVLDSTPPTASVAAPASVNPDQLITLTGSGRDAGGLDSTTLYTRPHGSSARPTLVATGGRTVTASVPAPPAGDLDAWAVGKDLAGNAFRTPTKVVVVDRAVAPLPDGIVGASGPGVAALLWDSPASPGLAGFDVQRAASASGPWTDAGSVGPSSRRLVLDGLSNGVPVSLRVRSRLTNGRTSAYSAAASATPHDLSGCDGPMTQDEVVPAGLHVITCGISIPAGRTLLVLPGAAVKTSGIAVDGHLVLGGTSADPVVVTSLCDDSVGGPIPPGVYDCAAASSPPLDLGVQASTSRVVGEHADLRHTHLHVTCECPVALTNSAVSDTAMQFQPGSPDLVADDFTRSTIEIDGGAPVLADCTFAGADYPVTLAYSASLAGVHGNSARGAPRERVFSVVSADLTSGTWMPEAASSGITHVWDAVTVETGASVAVSGAAVVKVLGLTVDGGDLSVDQGAILTSQCDDTANGDTRPVDSDYCGPGGARLIASNRYLRGTIRLDHVDLRSSDLLVGCNCDGSASGTLHASTLHSTAVTVQPASLAVTDNAFVASTLTLTEGAPVVTGNSFTGADYPLHVSGASSLAGMHDNTASGTPRERVFTVIQNQLTSGTWMPEGAASGVIHDWEYLTVSPGATISLGGAAVVKATGITLDGGAVAVSGATLVTSECDDAAGGPTELPGSSYCGEGGANSRATLRITTGSLGITGSALRYVDLFTGCVCDAPATGSIATSTLQDSALDETHATVSVTDNALTRSTASFRDGPPVFARNSVTGVDYPVTFVGATSMAGVHDNTAAVAAGGTDRQRVFTTAISSPAGTWTPETLGANGIVQHWEDVDITGGSTVTLGADGVVKVTSISITGQSSFTATGPGFVTSECDPNGGVTVRADTDCSAVGRSSVGVHDHSALELTKVTSVDTDWTVGTSTASVSESTLDRSRWEVKDSSSFTFAKNTLTSAPLSVAGGTKAKIDSNSFTSESNVSLVGQPAPSVTSNTWKGTDTPLGVLGTDDLSGITSSNSAEGSTLQRTFDITESSVAPGKSWTLAAVAKTVYRFEGVGIPVGATVTASDAEIHLVGDQFVLGTLSVSGSKLIDNGVRAMTGSTVTITGSQIGGSFTSDPGCAIPFPTSTVTGNVFVSGGSITNCISDVPGGQRVIGTGNTGVGSYSSHLHACVWPVPENPVLHPPYPRRVWDVVWEMPDDPPCRSGYIDAGH